MKTILDEIEKQATVKNNIKNLYLKVISIFFINFLVVQNNAIKMTNLNTNKGKVIKENRKIKIKTTENKKIKGSFKIVNNSIRINDILINLTDIKELKRNPLLTSIIISGGLVLIGTATTSVVFIIGIIIETAALWYMIPTTAITTVGILSPNINKNHKMDKGWKFEFISIPD